MNCREDGQCLIRPKSHASCMCSCSCSGWGSTVQVTGVNHRTKYRGTSHRAPKPCDQVTPGGGGGDCRERKGNAETIALNECEDFVLILG